MSMYVFWFSIAVLASVPLYFVWNEVYKDGVIGRIALLGISFFAWSFVIEAVFVGAKYTLLNQTVALVFAFAVFLVWHLWRFHRRVLRKTTHVYLPDCPADRRKVPDRRFLAS